jgi:cytochrome P450
MNATSTLSRATSAADAVHAIPIEQIDVSDPKLFQDDTIHAYFARLRTEDPVHFCKESRFGSYWSITKYNHIMQVDTNHVVFSSGVGGINILDRKPNHKRMNFLNMDPPKHDEQRKTVSPVVAPTNLAKLEHTIRERAGTILDALPRNETFNWVEKVSIELTTQMLATLFDFPWEDRRLLTYWSDVAVVDTEAGGPIDSEDKREDELFKCLDYFRTLWDQRANSEPRSDLVSMLAHSPATRNLGPQELLHTLILLIVGGNDTTRNSITGGLWALSQNPAEYQKLRDNPGLIPNMVSEIVRYQTPLAHMRRTALVDIEFEGKQIRQGDKVVMWYLSGNRDGEVIENPDSFIIDRPRARQHLSFGFGIHRCVGNRLAEMQLKILWEEAMARFPVIEVVGEPERIYSNFIHGYKSLPVRISG